MNNDDRLDALNVLDPERDDPGYWVRFHRVVVDRAVLELARRREMARATISGVLSGWSRSLIPVGLAAAAIALFMVLSEGRSDLAGVEAQPLALEEVLDDDVEESSFRAVTTGTTDATVEAFMTAVEEDVPR